jgi:glycerophosphoryl diester phosphodiesterase
LQIHRKFIDKLRVVFILTLLISVTVNVWADRLPWIGAQRYAFGGVNLDFVDNDASLYLDIFNGDYPYILQATHDTVSLYTGFPYFHTAPFFFSLGSKTQLGAFDYYNPNTLFQSGSFGWDVRIKDHPSMEYFISHSIRLDPFTAGWAYYGEINRLDVQASAVFDHLAVYADASFDMNSRQAVDWSLGFDVMAEKTYALRIRLNSDFSVTAAMGIAHRKLPNDKAKNMEWNFVGAHRGSIEKYPENSLPALTYALNNPGYTFIETDLNATLDGKYATIHDPVLLRYTGESLWLNEMTMEQLKTKDVGSFYAREFSDVRILSLEDLGEIFGSRPDKHLMIEVKFIGDTDEDVKRAVQEVKETFPDGNFSLMSLYHQHVDALKAYSGDIPWGFCYLNPPFLPPFLMPYSHVYPLLEFELDKLRTEYDPDFIILFMDAIAFYDRIKVYALAHEIDILFWDFKDNLYGISGDGGDSPMFMR